MFRSKASIDLRILVTAGTMATQAASPPASSDTSVLDSTAQEVEVSASPASSLETPLPRRRSAEEYIALFQKLNLRGQESFKRPGGLSGVDSSGNVVRVRKGSFFFRELNNEDDPVEPSVVVYKK